MKRAYRGFMAIKSVVVGVLILVLWGRSYMIGDSFMRGSAAQHIQLGSAAGVMIVQFVHDGKATELNAEWRRERTHEPREMLDAAGMGESIGKALGFGFNHRRIAPPARGMIVNLMMPHWAMFLLAMPSAFLWMARRKRANAKPDAKVFVWCPACVRELERIADCCPTCGGPVGVKDSAEDWVRMGSAAR